MQTGLLLCPYGNYLTNVIGNHLDLQYHNIVKWRRSFEQLQMVQKVLTPWYLFPQSGATSLVRQALRCRTVKLLVSSLAIWPLISLLHETIVVVVAVLLSIAMKSGLPGWLIEVFSMDKVYASVAFQMMGNIQPLGMSVAGPLGDALHFILPAIFLDPGTVAPGAWASAVMESGGSLLTRTIARGVAAGVLISLGLALFRFGLKGQRLRGLVDGPANNSGVVFLGLMLQIRAITTILRLPNSIQHLETMGLPQILTKLIPSTQQSYDAVRSTLEPITPVIIPIVLLGILYGASLAVVKALSIIYSRIRRPAPHRTTTLVDKAEYPSDQGKQPGDDSAKSHRPSKTYRTLTAVPLLPSLIVLVVLLAVTNIGGARTNADYPFAPVADDENAPTDTALAVPNATPRPSRSTLKPSLVTISWTAGGYEYLVNGAPETIRGVGYNVQYENLTDEERIAAYQRDFRKMKEVGINTILGWDQNRFDEQLLSVAHENGIGVVLPYHLPPRGDYWNLTYRQQLKDDITAWVMRFKKNPALRMWGIGNEVLHDMQDKKQTAAFAEFYRDIADSVHQLDPDHLVIYREAEDVFVPILKQAIKRDKVARPWLVYGMNIFTYRLKKVLVSWPRQEMDMPLVISEFAPTGLGARDRPAAYATMWNMLREHRSIVLGGFMYVWTTNGPEPLDRVYGLVNEKGIPTDGSLEAMRTLFHNETQSTN